MDLIHWIVILFMCVRSLKKIPIKKTEWEYFVIKPSEQLRFH
ncbi:unnamed protein product [Acanthoscelides obtectus]|uniref:ATP synthase F0 subunit 8 n=1 Tax=Acanthoscelides obtectus TaxID=200917 RepID=A0A9P0K3T8_ACAOB|nr:unnamed protein product [Acanthoscelides obtectus]CAK1638103.1 hypothetical protein AOBTE_LOCUS10387 [Acanthoscelides obtectus]